MIQRPVVIAILFAALLPAQNNWFDPAMLEQPEAAKAIMSIDERSSAIIDGWIRITELPAPSKQEQTHAEYMRAEMEKRGLADIRADDMLNVSGVRKGTLGGPTVVFAAHTDTVFPIVMPIQVKREGDILNSTRHWRRHRQPHTHARDVPRPQSRRRENHRRPDVSGFCARGNWLLRAKHWLASSGHKPDISLPST